MKSFASVALNALILLKLITDETSGGFFVESAGVWFLVGIVSSGLIWNKCPETQHSVYTKVSAFGSWIKEVMAQFYAKQFWKPIDAGQPITLRNAPAASSTSSSSTLLIYTTYHEVRLANLSRNNVTTISVLTKDLNEGAGLDFYYDKQLICWTDQALEAIQCRKMNESYYKEPPSSPVGIEELTDNIDKLSVITKGIEKPEGLAIDWYTDKIYWADGELNRIEVATLNGKYQKLLFWTDLDQPRAIALVPSKQFIIWTDWGESPKIERASMDGDKSSRIVLVHERIFWPNGLAVDIENNLIYWVDGSLRFLDVMNMDGTGRRTVIKDLNYPYSITYINKKLFWCDWNDGSINSYDLENGEQRQVIDSPDVPITVRAWDKSLQQVGVNPCRTNNGNCSHLCLLATNSRGYSCACPTGVRLLTETQCANGPQNVIFIVQRTQISRISLDSPDFTSFPLSLGRVKSAISIDYDPVDDFIYWTDEEQHAIKRSRQDGTVITDVINTEIKQPDGLAVDWIARNLYWADSGSDRIEVSRLNGDYRRVLIHDNLEEPRDVAVAPTLGWMFWSDWGKKPKIERASLDGTERVMLVSDDLGWPNGIALDVELKKIYWCDAKMDKIEVTNMDGTDRRVILNENLPHVFGLSLFDNFIYWTDWQRRTVERAHKITGNDRVVVVDQFPDLMGLKVAKLQEIKGSNPCMNKNGGCAHLCLNRPRDYVCRCSIDQELAKDRKGCSVPAAFLLFSKGENIGRLSIGYNDEAHPDIFIPFKDLRDAYHLDVDVSEKRIYWTDRKLRCISRAFINGSDVQKIVDSGIVSPEGIAVDWIAHNIYWTDSEARRIEVARLDGSSRRILIWKGIEEPKNIIVEPRKGFIYWTENPSDSIRRAASDGTDLQTIVSNANHPTSLTMDFEQRRLYWATKNGIEYADWDGKGRKKLKLAGADAENSFKTRSLTLYQDNIYWTDDSSGDIERADKLNGTDRAVIYKNLRDVSSLLVFHNNRQQGSNLCRVNNGDCSHLCFALPGHKKTCACPTHFTLTVDGINCSPPRSYLVFSQKSSFGRLLPNSSDSPDAPLPVSAKNIKAVEYDPIQHYLYWIDGRSTVKKSLDNGTKTSLVIGGSGSHSQPFDLAIDIVGRLLFWTCSHANTINITSLDTYDPVGIVDTGNSQKPRSIAVHPIRRFLFWTDVGSQQAVIRARMDGSNSIVLANKLEGVTSLALDPISNVVFFSHGRKIESVDINGKNRKVLPNSNINQVHSIAAFPNVVYWLDEKFGLEKATISGESIRLEKKYPQITDIVAVWHPDAKIIKNHLCVSQKNKCSHICIASMNNSKADEMCSCPQGLTLMKDRRNCGALPACGPDHFTCTSSFSSNNGLSADHNRDCIPSSWRCDGQTDCPDKSDELDCPTCSAEQFRCNNGDCIEKSFVCDGTTNCDDGQDEAMCCNLGDFQCASNQVCIPQGLLCDGWDHCADGSDENNDYCASIAITQRASSGSDKKFIVVILIVLVLIIFFIVYVLQICRTKFADTIRGQGFEPKEDHASAPLSPGGLNSLRNSKITTVGDAVRLNPLSMNSYDRNNITGASSSTTTNGSLIAYPSNPPPSPATTSTLHNSYPYKHYKVINQAPPTTPCSTDVCESDSNYTPISIKSSKKSGDSYAGNIYMGSISNGSNNNKSF